MRKDNNYKDKSITRGRGISIVREVIDKYISRNSGGQSLITITSMVQADKSNHMTVGVSVLPDNKAEAVIDFLKRNATEIRDEIKDKTRMGMIPYLQFELDRGEKHRQEIFDII